MGQNTGASGKSKKVEEEMKKETLEGEEEVEEHDEQDGMSVHSPCKPQSSALRKVELEIRLLEALEIYPPAKLRGIHRHFVLYGLTEYLRRSFNRQFAPDDVLKLLDRFYNLDMVKPDDEDAEILNQEEEFCLPQSYFSKEES
ncbi:uncharacterized protein LOC132067856 isoform X2 [Lycium ferocissimum]|uniref:uncharacterized protein LOC132067856 isoform X2 n=1 Tax=Lycium ferocissimum TaxID=112874 RepID=UPI0028167150|nr:uncharacterized protein LOC132067856 isoform X2 [Lycium ferocissimum]